MRRQKKTEKNKIKSVGPFIYLFCVCFCMRQVKKNKIRNLTIVKKEETFPKITDFIVHFNVNKNYHVSRNILQKYCEAGKNKIKFLKSHFIFFFIFLKNGEGNPWTYKSCYVWPYYQYHCRLTYKGMWVIVIACVLFFLSAPYLRNYKW